MHCVFARHTVAHRGRTLREEVLQYSIVTPYSTDTVYLVTADGLVGYDVALYRTLVILGPAYHKSAAEIYIILLVTNRLRNLMRVIVIGS